MQEYQTNQQQDNQGYQLSRYRYINLAVFMFAALVNSLAANTFSSINSQVEELFDTSRVVVTLNALLFPIFHPISAYPASWILDNYGIRVGCTIGGVLLVSGVWLRTLLSPGQPYLCLAGSILAAIGNIFVLGSPTMLAINWFDSDSAPKVISATVLLNFLSSGLGAGFGGFFVKQDSTWQDVVHFLRVEAIIITIPFIFLIIFFRQKPDSPPSHAAALKNINGSHIGTNKPPYIQTIKNLFKNKAYLKICLAMSLSYGGVISFFSVVNQCLTILKARNPSVQTSTTVLSALLFGLFSTIFFSFAVRKTQQYRFIIGVCLLGAMINFFLLNMSFLLDISGNLALFFVAGFAGFFVIPLTALFTSYASEAAFPQGQGSVTGYLFAISQTFGFVVGIISVSWIDKQSVWKIWVILMVHSSFFIMSFLVNLNTKQELNKTKYQRDNRQQGEKDSSLIVPLEDDKSVISN